MSLNVCAFCFWLRLDRSRVRGIVSNVVQMLSSFLPVDVVSKVRAVLPRQQQEHAQPQQQAPSRRSLFPPAPVTPRASIRDPRSARRSSDPLRNKGYVHYIQNSKSKWRMFITRYF